MIPRSASVALLVAAVAVAGCGGSGKPAYCSDRSKLESSIKDLPSQTLSGGTSGLKSQLTTIQSDAATLVDSAKSDFPSETSAIRSSVDQLASAVDALPSSPSATQVAAVAADSASVAQAVKRFSDGTSSKCD